jgi:hypothetical protein
MAASLSKFPRGCNDGVHILIGKVYNIKLVNGALLCCTRGVLGRLMRLDRDVASRTSISMAKGSSILGRESLFLGGESTHPTRV